jgi:hypothetical protein
VLVAHGNQPHRPAGQGLLAGVLALQRQGMPFAWLG